ncbi:uncharacterized protein IWZ02DRAFT_520988 [Phyllosticta citriasiana]|uniref:uncharacterized protein n=1 Tax=Phyllosticta citriasiana TaxID=595635 RepID=UPI0030FD228E
MEDEPTTKRAKLTKDDSPSSTKPSTDDAAALKLAEKIQLDIPSKIEKQKHHRDHQLLSNRFRSQMKHSPTTKHCAFTKQSSADKATSFTRRAPESLLSPKRVIEISYEDTEAVLYMIQWMYTSKHEAPAGQKALPLHIRLYSAADFYQVRMLKREMIGSVTHDVCPKQPGLPEAIDLIFSSTPESDRGLRDAVVAFCANNYAYCARYPEFDDIQVVDFWRELCLETKDDLYDKNDALDNFDAKRYDAVMLRTFREFRCKECRIAFMIPEGMSEPENCVSYYEDDV